MLISAREAADVLAPLGLSRESTRRVLRAGLAGVGQATKASFLYEHERVVALCEWPLVDPGRLDAAVHGGVFVARLGAGLDVGQHASPDHWRNASRGPWRVSPWLRARMSITLERQSFVPLVATMGGFVVLGADITGGCSTLAVRPRSAINRDGPARSRSRNRAPGSAASRGTDFPPDPAPPGAGGSRGETVCGARSARHRDCKNDHHGARGDHRWRSWWLRVRAGRGPARG